VSELASGNLEESWLTDVLGTGVREEVRDMSTVTLEQVEALAMQLPTHERFKLAARLIAGCGEVADDSQGMDTAEIIRRMREERISAICEKDAPRHS
jgi:hypothetical protein